MLQSPETRFVLSMKILKPPSKVDSYSQIEYLLSKALAAQSDPDHLFVLIFAQPM